MKYILFLFVFTISFIVNAQNSSDAYYVSDISNLSEIQITASGLNALAKEYGFTADFSEFKVQKAEDHYVLLAKDLAQKWIYAFELKNISSKLYIDIDKHINACESEKLSIDVFTISEGEISGCIQSELHVLGRN